MTIEHGKMVFYQVENGQTAIDVCLEGETVWLSQAQMVDLFQKTKQNISLHIRNLFCEGELLEESVVKESLTTGADGKRYRIKYYNLDVIISVGYRVKSQRGTQFRIWATSILKDHLIKGYTINQKRLAEKGITEASQMLSLLKNTLISQDMVSDEGRDILDLVNSYAKTWQLLWQYDEDSLSVPKSAGNPSVPFDLDQARKAIASLKRELLAKDEATDIFGQERGEGFAGITGTIQQTFGGQELYPAIVDKAAHLLYFVIKDHPFVDGNKRIGSFLFLLYLRLNNQSQIFTPETMVALTLLVAASEANQKDVLVKLIVNLLLDLS